MATRNRRAGTGTSQPCERDMHPAPKQSENLTRADDDQSEEIKDYPQAAPAPGPLRKLRPYEIYELAAYTPADAKPDQVAKARDW